MLALKFGNVALRGLLEAGVVAALAYWGIHTGESVVDKVVLGVLAPAVGFGIWGAVDFRDAGSLAELLRLLEELVISGIAAVALYTTGQHALAWALALLSLLHHALVYLLGMRLLDEKRAGVQHPEPG